MGRLDTRYSPVRRSPSTEASFSHDAPRLACVKPVASVHPEPGSNSPLYIFFSLHVIGICFASLIKTLHISLKHSFVCLLAQDDLFYQVPFQELMVRISFTQMILLPYIYYKVYETSASCTTCLSVYVNLIKERLSFCAFVLTRNVQNLLAKLLRF